MDPAEFRRLGHELVDWVADYREHIAELPVMSRVAPGEIQSLLPGEPPQEALGLDDITAELEELEGRGAKKNEIERAEKAKNKDFEDIRLRYEEEIGQLKQVWDTLKSMKPKQLIDDERVWRELVDRYHDYFAGGMGAESIRDLLRERLLNEEVERWTKGLREKTRIVVYRRPPIASSSGSASR